jgi:uncharacterized protein
MDITPPIALGKQLIQSYGGGGFRIADHRYSEPVLVSEAVTTLWPVSDMASIDLESFAALRQIEPGPTLLLLGCGENMQPLAGDIRAALRDWGIVVELMATGPACRTFNVLLSEQRRVAAALFPVA